MMRPSDHLTRDPARLAAMILDHADIIDAALIGGPAREVHTVPWAAAVVSVANLRNIARDLAPTNRAD
jgi:hypothetical protein